MKVTAALALGLVHGLLRGEPSLVHTQVGQTVAKVDYPCGNATKVAGFTKYRANLLKVGCESVAPAKAFCGDTHGFECMLNEFYSADCAGLTSAPADLCAKCKHPCKNLASGEECLLPLSYFPIALTNFYKNYNFAYFDTITSSALLKDELYCSSMMMVQDGCAKGTTRPKCST
jgi:hypothetical protein